LTIQANAICESVIGTIRRECLDWLIPLSESHLRSMLKVWVTHCNAARPYMALCPGVPDPPAGVVLPGDERSRHHLDARAVLCARSVLGGLHHEYSLQTASS
jgi:putative transposase